MAIKKRLPDIVSQRKHKPRFRIDFTYTKKIEDFISLYPHEHDKGKCPTPRELFGNEYNGELVKASVFVPYRCTQPGCSRQVNFKVNGFTMCQSHMLAAIKKGNNPEIFPFAHGESVPLDLDKHIPSDLLITPMDEDVDE